MGKRKRFYVRKNRLMWGTDWAVLYDHDNVMGLAYSRTNARIMCRALNEAVKEKKDGC